MEINHRYCEHNKRNNTKVLQTPFLEQKKYTYIFDILQQERKTVLVLFKLIWEMNTVFTCFNSFFGLEFFQSNIFFLSELFSFKEIESVLKFKWNIILFWLFPRNKLRKFENHYMDFSFWNSGLFLKIICYSKIFFFYQLLVDNVRQYYEHIKFYIEMPKGIFWDNVHLGIWMK